VRSKDKPYRVYRAGRARGPIGPLPPLEPEAAPVAEDGGDGYRILAPELPAPEAPPRERPRRRPRRLRLRGLRWILLGLVVVLLAFAGWGAAGYFALRHGIADANRREAESAYVDRVIDEALKAARIEFPPLMVDEELDEMLERTDKRVRDQGLNLEEYLKVLGKTRDEYRAEMRPTAEARIRRGLLLSRVVEMEGLRVEGAEIDRGIDAASAAYGQQADTVRKTLSKDESRRRLELELLTQKALNRLAAIAKGEAPPLAEPAKASA